MISIIIPIYNTSKYLKQCLDSIINQSYKDLEIILVNDASTDNSLLIAQNYKNRDPRIKIINKEVNEGLELARYSGYKISKGDYIMHLDSDDWLADLNIINKMYDIAISTDVDYVEMGMQRIMDKHAYIKKKGICQLTGLIEGDDFFEKYYISFFGINILPVNAWGKLYKRQLIEKACPKPYGVTMGEDLVYNMQLFPHIKKIYILKDTGYNYRFGGMTSRYNKRLYPDLRKIYSLKKLLIDYYNYSKATDFIRIEMKNILKSEICQQIIYQTGTPKDIINRIKTELNDPLFTEITEVSKKHIQFHNDPFTIMLKEKNADGMFDYCQKQVQKTRFSRKVKGIISWMLVNL